MLHHRISVLSAACAMLMLAGCAAPAAHRAGKELIGQGQMQAGLNKLDEAVRLDPSSMRYRVDLLRQREQIANELVDRGDAQRRAGQAEGARKQYEAALAVQPAQERAVAGIDALARDAANATLMQQARGLVAAGDAGSARAKADQVLAGDPRQRDALILKASLDAANASAGGGSAALAAAYRSSISLEFRETPLRAIFEVLSRSAKLNFIFDRDVKLDQRASIFLRDSTIESALDLLMVTNQLALRTLDGNSVLIYPADPAKRKDYEPLGVRAFYLLHTDAKSFGATLKTILKSKDVVVVDKLNLVILHDTWDSIRLAEKLAALQDVAEPEVMLEVEVLEVKRSRLSDLGVQWPDQLSLTALPLSGGSSLTLSDLKHLNRSNVGVSALSVTANLSAQDVDADILANPRIRTHSREKAKILIGERVPSPVSTATSTGFVSESISYLDVGLKLEVEPVVYPDDEVSIQIALEVSSINSQQTTAQGSIAYQIGTRNAQTVLRLKNNENTILAGLINDEDRRSANAIPLLGDIPIIGHLFGKHTVDKAKTEIVLSITPRIVRNVPAMPLHALQFDAGTESTPRSPALRATIPAINPLVIAVPQAPDGSKQAPVAPQSSGSQANARVSLLGPAQAKPGDEIRIDIDLQSDQPIVSVPLTIGFDPKAITPLEVQPGKFLEQGGGTVNAGSFVGEGQVSITERIVDGIGGLSQDHVATILFKVLPDAPSPTKVQILSIAPTSAAGQAFTLPPQPLALTIKR